MRKQTTLATTLFLASLGFGLLLTSPATLYRGDPFAIRAGAAQFVDSGWFGIPYRMKAGMQSFASTRGQYFFENDEAELFYSKYGVFASLLFVPPLAVHALLFDSFLIKSDAFILMENLYRVLLSVLFFWLLFKITALFNTPIWTRFAFIIATGFCGYLWNYLRAQSTELFVMIFFAVLFLYSVRFIREGTKKNLHFILGAAACLLLIKPYFALVYPLLFISLFQAKFSFRMTKEQKYFLIISAISGIVFLALNAIQFGSPLTTGYSQWETSPDWFGLSVVPRASLGFLLSWDRGVLFYFPLILIALLYWKTFFLHFRKEAILLLVLTVPFFFFFCTFSNWQGHWSYGPRYLSFLLPLLGLPAILIEPKKILISIPAGMILLVSFLSQLPINQIGFFANYDLEAFFEKIESYDIKKYLLHSHTSTINRDLIRMKKGEVDIPPIDLLYKRFPDQREKTNELKALILKDELLNSNYYFFR